MQSHPCCRQGYPGELCSLYERLLRPENMDKHDCLNSDGRRLLHRLLKLLVDTHPEHRRLAKRTRRNPCLEQLAKLAELTFYNCSPETPHLTARGTITPYKHIGLDA